jgi:hypothetical protein
MWLCRMNNQRLHSYRKRARTKFLYAYLPVIHRMFHKNEPVLLINAIHKAGTHMLTDAIAEAIPIKYNERGIYNHAFSRTWPTDKSEKNTSAHDVIEFLRYEAWPGEIIRGHVEYSAELAKQFGKGDLLHVLVVRKPLDTLLSLANWWERHDEIPTIAFTVYKSIKDPEEKLRFLLTGLHKDKKIWPDLVSRLNEYVQWLHDKNTLVLHYEDLLDNPKACGSKLATHLNMPFNMARFLKKLKNRGSRTYTRAEDKVYTSLSTEIIEEYKHLGGLTLEKSLGY